MEINKTGNCLDNLQKEASSSEFMLIFPQIKPSFFLSLSWYRWWCGAEERPCLWHLPRGATGQSSPPASWWRRCLPSKGNTAARLHWADVWLLLRWEPLTASDCVRRRSEGNVMTHQACKLWGLKSNQTNAAYKSLILRPAPPRLHTVICPISSARVHIFCNVFLLWVSWSWASWEETSASWDNTHTSPSFTHESLKVAFSLCQSSHFGCNGHTLNHRVLIHSIMQKLIIWGFLINFEGDFDFFYYFYEIDLSRIGLKHWLSLINWLKNKKIGV